MTTKRPEEAVSQNQAQEPAPVKYVATGEIKFGIHAGYQEGHPVPEDVVKNYDLVDQGLVKKV